MRTQGVGKLSGPEAMNLGVTGPIMRGSNVDFDLRRDDPYEKYSEIDFRRLHTSRLRFVRSVPGPHG